MKVRVTLSIGLANATREDELEFDDADVKGMTADELDKFLYTEWTEWAWQFIDGGPTVIDGPHKKPAKKRRLP